MEELLVEKYRPKYLKDLILDNNIKLLIENMIKTKNINNLIFYGHQGIGKTSLAKIIINELNYHNYLYINASLDNNIDTVRTKIKDFCDTLSYNNELKIVILDECDAITGPAQAALRNLIEESSKDTRFILTCNYIDKIIEPIQSRCVPIKIIFNLNDVIKKILYILKEEKVKVDKEVFKLFIEKIIKQKFPDIRLIIGILQQSIINNKLIFNEQLLNDSIINEIIEKINTCNLTQESINNLRKYILDNQNLFNKDYIELSQKLFYKCDNIEGMLIIADSIYRMHIVLDKEIEFIAMILNLKKNKIKI